MGVRCGGMATVRRRTKIVATIGPVSSNHDTMRALVDALHRQPDEPVVDQHVVSGAQDLADHGRSDRQLAVDGHLLADHEDLLVLEQHARRQQVADAELRALQVGDQRERLTGLVLHLAHHRGARRMIVVRAVRKIQADGIDTRVDERPHDVVTRRHGPDRRDDLRPAADSCHVPAAYPPCLILAEDGRIIRRADDTRHGRT